MGTNYYINSKPACPTCGHREEPLHIGKASAGWKFLFASYPYKGINTRQDWAVFMGMTDEVITDEYGHRLTRTEFWDKVEKHQDESQPRDNDSVFFKSNYEDFEGYIVSSNYDFT